MIRDESYGIDRLSGSADGDEKALAVQVPCPLSQVSSRLPARIHARSLRVGTWDLGLGTRDQAKRLPHNILYIFKLSGTDRLTRKLTRDRFDKVDTVLFQLGD